MLQSNNSGLSRREMLAASALALGTFAISQAPGSESIRRTFEPAVPLPRQRSIRIAHLTDMHIQPERAADQGVMTCLEHVHSQKSLPDLILTGGDHIMDGFEADETRTDRKSVV